MTFRLALTLAVAAAVMACGADPDSAVPAAGAAAPSAAAATAAADGRTEPQPCDLLSPDDVQRVLGDAVSQPEPMGRECSYRRLGAPGELRTLAARVRLEIGEGAPRDLFDRYIAALRAVLGADYDPLVFSGLGEVAAWDGDAILTSLSFEGTRSAVVVVQLTGVEPENERQMAEALAAVAIGRLR
jgi:hypothetical protein